MKTSSLLLFIALIFASAITNAKTPPPDNKPVVAVLVQLKAEKNRIEALTRAHKKSLLENVIIDRGEVINAMTADFTDHFSYCPVYYYMDTNVDAIQNKHFANVLLNADLTPAKNIAFNPENDKYVVVYYGDPVKQSRDQSVVTDTMAYLNADGKPEGRGLVILNSNLQQISFFYKFGYDDVFLKMKYGSKYCFSSKHFQMEYYPFAKKLNTAIKKHADRIRISK